VPGAVRALFGRWREGVVLLFAAYQVPYLSTPADVAIGYHERTRVMGFRWSC
jgi:hypothetical protein